MRRMKPHGCVFSAAGLASAAAVYYNYTGTLQCLDYTAVRARRLTCTEERHTNTHTHRPSLQMCTEVKHTRRLYEVAQVCARARTCVSRAVTAQKRCVFTRVRVCMQGANEDTDQDGDFWGYQYCTEMFMPFAKDGSEWHAHTYTYIHTLKDTHPRKHTRMTSMQPTHINTCIHNRNHRPLVCVCVCVCVPVQNSTCSGMSRGSLRPWLRGVMRAGACGPDRPGRRRSGAAKR
jgi:hypothetical protein